MRHPTSGFIRWTWPLLLALLLGGWSCTHPADPELATPSIKRDSIELGAVSPGVASLRSTPSMPPDPTTVAKTQPAASQVDDRSTRVVWTRDTGKGTDFFSLSNRLILMGYDSRDGRGERVLLKRRASYAKPLITPSGNEIVYTLRAQNAVFAVPWGKRRRRASTQRSVGKLRWRA